MKPSEEEEYEAYFFSNNLSLLHTVACALSLLLYPPVAHSSIVVAVNAGPVAAAPVALLGQLAGHTPVDALASAPTAPAALLGQLAGHTPVDALASAVLAAAALSRVVFARIIDFFELARGDAIHEHEDELEEERDPGTSVQRSQQSAHVRESNPASPGLTLRTYHRATPTAAVSKNTKA